MDRRAAKKLLGFVDAFPAQRVLVIGDLMLDHYIRGTVSRISPEAPVPVVRASNESFLPGGSGNVATQIAVLDAKVSVLGVVGADAEGETTLSELRRCGADTRPIVVDPERVTTQKVRVIAEHQQIVRFDREAQYTLSARTLDALRRKSEALIPEHDAVVLSDYGKGVLNPSTLRRILQVAKKAKVPVIVDPKPENLKNYKGVRCLTPNLLEAFTGMGQPVRSDDAAVQDMGRRILRALQSESVIITRGDKGMSLFERRRPTKARHIPTQAREVFDVTGAGDTVIATLTLALSSGASLVEAAHLANFAAGIVVGKLGTATTDRAELRAAVRRGNRR